jgi:hypothetical protein
MKSEIDARCFRLEFVFLSISLAVLGGGCGKSDDSGATPTVTRVKEGPGPTGDTTLITKVERDKIVATLQGRWLVPGRVTDDPSKPSPMGLNTVWEITGEKLVTWDGEKEQAGRIEIVAPCLARVFHDEGDGHESFSYETLHVGGGTFVRGKNVAYRRGDSVMGCLSHGAVFVHQNGACLTWDHPRAAAGKGTKADCRVEGETLVISGEIPWALPIIATDTTFPTAYCAKKINSREDALSQ